MNVFLEFWYTLWILIKSITLGIIYSIISPPLKSVQDEIVLITGAGSGLGRLMCIEFAKRGAQIVACDISKPGNEETAQIVKEKGGRIYTYICDVSKKEEVFKLAERVQRDVGHVDILVNNAGIVSGKNFLDISDHMIQKTMDVNVMAHFWTIKSFLPSMVSRNHGHIVTIASSAGIFACNRLTDYCASKFANVGFAETLDAELNAANLDGVHTTVICPFFIDTGMFDGCQTKFPSILPVLDPNTVVQKIVKSVLTNQRLVIIPRMLYIFHVVKTLIPYEAGIQLTKFFGAMNLMDTFIGRQKQNKKKE